MNGYTATVMSGEEVGRVILTFPYCPALVAKIKGIVGWRYMGPGMPASWAVPASQEETARALIRQHYQIEGEPCYVRYEIVEATVSASNTARRTYPAGVSIDGIQLFNLKWGNLIERSSVHTILEAHGGYTSGDAHHAFSMEFRIKVKTRVNAEWEVTGNNVARGCYEIIGREPC